MISNWVLVLVFTSFFNGNSHVETISGFSSKVACEAASSKIVNNAERPSAASCIEVK